MNNFKKINNILQDLDNKTEIYICGHLQPDQDSICSSLALKEYLKFLGKKVFVLLEDKEKDIISWLEGDSDIKNNISTNNYVFIALDVNDKKRLGVYEKYFDMAKYKINIDHHQDNKYQADYTLSLPTLSATCEIIYNIINQNKNAFTKKICSCLYAGMLGDTNGFTRRLTKKTLTIAQKLINFGIDYVYIINKTFSARTLYEYKALAKLINEIKFDGFHYVVVDKSLPEFKDLTYNDILKKLAEDLRKINTIDIFLLLIVTGNTITAKVMSNKSENANVIASIFGGGGHKKEAGFTVTLSLEDIIQKTKQFLGYK